MWQSVWNPLGEVTDQRLSDQRISFFAPAAATAVVLISRKPNSRDSKSKATLFARECEAIRCKVLLQLQFPSDQRALGSDRNHDSISHRREDTGGDLSAKAQPRREFFSRNRYAIRWRHSDSCHLLLVKRHLVFLPPLYSCRLRRCRNRARSIGVQDIRDRQVIAVQPDRRHVSVDWPGVIVPPG